MTFCTNTFNECKHNKCIFSRFVFLFFWLGFLTGVSACLE